MRVVLINPPALYNLGVCHDPKIKKNLGYYPPLGILYVASYAEKFTNHTIRVLDAQVEQLDYNGLEERIRAEC